MHDFVSHVLQQYFRTTGWSPENSYLNLTSSSSCILDFPIPNGLSLSISASPSPPFFYNTYTLSALPSLKGSVGYIFTSIDPDNTGRKINVGQSSQNVNFRDMTTRYRTLPIPNRPQPKEEIWLAGKRIDTRDYLLYGCMHVPSSRLDALFTTRLSSTLQFFATAISLPPKTFPSGTTSGETSFASNSNLSGLIAGPTNLQMTMQRDTGKWCTEYSYSADDSLWGFRVLHNFGFENHQNQLRNQHQNQNQNSNLVNSGQGQLEPNEKAVKSEPVFEAEQNQNQNSTTNTSSAKFARIDDQTSTNLDVGGGLRGRFSAGAEMFFSAAEKSAGLSTGIRFTTLPDPPIPIPTSTSSSSSSNSKTGSNESNQPVHPSQPPTTITATLNPMMGHLSTAYAARMSRDVVLCSRFDFNMYSYDSELTMGAEYWLRSSPNSSSTTSPSDSDLDSNPHSNTNFKSKSTPIPPLNSDSNFFPDSNPTFTSIDDENLERRATNKLRKELNLREPLETDPTRSPDFAKTVDRSLSLREVDQDQNSSSTLNLREKEALDVRDEKIIPTTSSASASATLSSTNNAIGKGPDKTETTTSIRSKASPSPAPLSSSSSPSSSSLSSPSSLSLLPQITGVVRARMNSLFDVSLLWEGKLRNCLVSIGVRADLSSRNMPLRGVGMEVMYFSGGEEEREKKGEKMLGHGQGKGQGVGVGIGEMDWGES